MRQQTTAPIESSAGDLLDELIQQPITCAPGSRGEAQAMGFCIDTEHPTLTGRIQVRWETRSGKLERWLPCLHHVVAREADRVLLAYADNAQEPIVVGVVDGFARRAEVPRGDAAVVEVKPDERLMVRAADGTPLVEVYQGERGPVVRVLSVTTQLRLPGTFVLDADKIELRARCGPVRIDASDDVDIQGEMIHLNSSPAPVATDPRTGDNRRAPGDSTPVATTRANKQGN